MEASLRLDLIRVDLLAMDIEPLSRQPTFSYFSLPEDVTGADWNPQVFDWKATNLTVKHLSIECGPIFFIIYHHYLTLMKIYLKACH